MAVETLDALKQEYTVTASRAEQLRRAIEILEGGILVGEGPTGTRRYEGLGIAEAARRFITESGGEPRTTSEIRDALVNNGWTTKSKNPTATVYATLENSRKFHRTKDGRWEPKKPQKGEQSA